MKTFLKLASILVTFISAQPQALALDGDNLLTTAVRLRLQSIAPVVLDPDIIDLKLLSTPVAINATTRSAAISELKGELEPRGLTTTDQGGVVWITKREAERDLSRQIALIINTPNYRQLANLLATESRSHPDPRLQRLFEMANYMAEQSTLPAKTKAFIDSKSKEIKNLQFMQRTALSGSSLSAPDPARAAALERDIDRRREEVLQYFNKLKDYLLSTVFNSADPKSAPPSVYAADGVIPAILFNRIALDAERYYAASLEDLLRALPDLGFTSVDTSSLRARLGEIEKEKILSDAQVARYLDLLGKAGLLGNSARQPEGRKALLGVEAANQLYNLFEDRREAVRLAIGANIMEQFEKLARSVKQKEPSFLGRNDTRELFLAGSREIDEVAKAFGKYPRGVQAYSPTSSRRIGAVTGLVVARGLGQASTFSIQIEPKDTSRVSEERSVSNILADKERLVSINTTADLSMLDGYLLGKGGSLATSDSAAFGEGGTIGSIGEALDLVKNDYDPSLYNSRIVVGFDQNFEIFYAGDSAGVAIAMAALSRLRSKPVDNRIMVTGAVRQFGDVRPVGGIYEKGVAALEAGALALLMPVSNLGAMLSLPTEKIISVNVISLNRFEEAAALAGLNIGEKSSSILEAVCLHNFGVMAAMAGKYAEALTFVEKAAALSPNHISAQVLKSVLRAGSVMPASGGPIVQLLEQASAFGNLASTNPIAISEGSTTGVTDHQGSVLGAIIPDFTVTGASGNEAFEALNNKARAAFGQPANITIRSKNDYFTTKFINLSIKNKTVSEILQQICDLCDAKFQQKGSAIVVDSILAPVVAELSSIVIPDFTVQDKSAPESFKYLADKAAEVSGKPVNIVLDSKNNVFRTLSINLSLQRKTFKEILDQLCLICDATVEQRGDAFIVTTPN